MNERQNVVVIGAGAFGTALAAVMSQQDSLKVTLVGRNPVLMSDLRESRVHDASLPGVPLPDALDFSVEPDVLSDARFVLFAMPSQAQADAARHYGPYLANEAAVITCAKGLERASGALLTEVLERELRRHSA